MQSTNSHACTGKKAAYSNHSNFFADKTFTPFNVMEAIVDVTNWRDLGLQLGLSSTRLNECDLDGNPKQKMIVQWMKEDPDASWERLQKALTTPAMCENRVAKSIADSGRGSSCSTANSGLLNRCFPAN